MSLDDILIRCALKKDFPAIEQLADCATWPFTPSDDQHDQESLEWMLAAAEGTNPRRAAWVAEAYGQTVAVIGIDTTAKDLAVVTWARVKQKWRHPSLVFRLLETVIQCCRARRVSRVCLQGQYFALNKQVSDEATPLLDPQHDSAAKWLGLQYIDGKPPRGSPAGD